MGIFKIILGAAEIAAGIALIVVTGGAGAYVGGMLIAAGAGSVISGVGTLLSGEHQSGFSTTQRNPIAPQTVGYGRFRTGGTLVYINEWGSDNQMLDMVIVLAGHPSQLGLASDNAYSGPGLSTSQASPVLPALYFDRKRVSINQNYVANYSTYGLPRPPCVGSGSSFSPASNYQNPKYNWTITSIVRSNDVVTITMSTGIPFLAPGDPVAIRNVTADTTLNGAFEVAQIAAVDSNGYATSFTVLNGGNPASITSQGQVAPLWADYGPCVYAEFLDGLQALGQTFVGFEAGTPWKATGQLVNPISYGPAGSGPNDTNLSFWTNYHSLCGKTALFLRLTYDQTYFPQGIPQISTLIRGKNDIFDPRTGTYGYTENAALCIADFLNGYAWKDSALETSTPPTGPFTTLLNPVIFGYDARYGVEIPLAMLTAAANICDQWVNTLNGVGPGISNTGAATGANKTEPMYSINGQFRMDMRRGEVLQNLLTACAGRITYSGGQFYIQPGYWAGGSPSSVDFVAIAAGPSDWRPTPQIKDLFNGVKGTYVSPANGWQASDFPYYAQDNQHGYDPSDLIPQYGGDANLEADGGQRRWKDIQLPFTISSSMAQRIAKIELLRTRPPYGATGTFRCNMAAYQFIPFDVLSAAHSFLWSGTKNLEVLSCRLKMDKVRVQDTEVALLGIELDTQATDSSIYAWSTTEELSPQGYQIAQIPSGQIAETYPWPWSPGYVSPMSGDALPNLPAIFGMQPVYVPDAQGSQTLTIQIKGTPAANVLDDEIGSPLITASASASGGSIPGGNYVVALAARDSGDPSNYKLTDFINACNVSVPSGTTGSITVDVVTWGSGDDGGDLYMAEWNAGEEYVWHYQATLASGATSQAITAFNQSTPAGPDADLDHYGIVWQEVIHSGPWADTIAALTATTLTIGGDGMTANQWAGYTLSVLAKAALGVDIPFLNIPIASSTASSGGEFTLTLGPNSLGQTLPDLTTLLAVGDLVVMRHKATFTATSFSDPNIANGYYPSGATSVERGHLAFVLTGADAGDVQTIDSVSQDGSGNYTIFNLQGEWAITPSTGDIVIICAPSQADFYATGPIQVKNSAGGSAVIAQPVVSNLSDQQWLLIVSTCDSKGNHGAVQYMPMRDIYIFGAGGTTTVTADYTMSPTDSTVLVDASSGNVTVTLPVLSSVVNQRVRVERVDSSSHTVTVVTQTGDSVTDGSGTWTTKGLTTQWDYVFLPAV